MLGLLHEWLDSVESVTIQRIGSTYSIVRILLKVFKTTNVLSII